MKILTTKKIVLCIVSMMLFAVSHSQDFLKDVGRLEDGKPVLTIEKSKAISALTRNLRKYSQLEVSFSSVSILQHKEKYWLVFNGSHRSSFNIKVEGTSLRAEVGISCTTSDCASETNGCVPESVPAEGVRCTPCANQGKCTKIVSTESLID